MEYDNKCLLLEGKWLAKADQDAWIRRLADSGQNLNIRLTNDFAFKKAFHNKKALTGLLSALLDIPADDIVKLEFPDTFLHGEYVEDREGFDLLQTENLFSVIRLMDDKTHRVYSDKLSLRMLYLKQLEKASEEEKKTDVYHWAKLISAKDWKVLMDMAEHNEYMKAAVDEMEKINADKALRYLYLRRELEASDKTSIREYYTQQGIKQGRIEGRDEGLSDGSLMVILMLEDGYTKSEIDRIRTDPEFEKEMRKKYLTK